MTQRERLRRQLLQITDESLKPRLSNKRETRKRVGRDDHLEALLYGNVSGQLSVTANNVTLKRVLSVMCQQTEQFGIGEM